MRGNHSNSGPIPFPLAERIPFPEPQIDPQQLENLTRVGAIKPELNFPTKFCFSTLKQGCYRISYKPNNNRTHFHGTLRVDRGEEQVAISGDLYKHWRNFNWRTGIKPTELFTLAPSRLRNIENLTSVFAPTIPIYSRNQYYSYLKVTGIKTNWWSCDLQLSIEEHVYNSSSESFSLDRTVNAVLAKQPGLSNKYSGTLENSSGAVLGSFSITWVSDYFRTAKLEVDTIEGAIAPQSVTVGSQTHSFRSIFKTAGWDLKVNYDQTNISNTYTGGSVDWTDAQMHQAMLDTRRASANLDREWLLHLLVVPENMGSGRGVMYDRIGVHREGVASFSNDGYPASSTPNWGTAANKLQRDVPPAFLRSACHEVGHGFNMIHQSSTGLGETGSDATVMTTSPSVANFIAANGGTFPDDIEFRFNAHVRHHLIHFPDIIVRPGGASWTAGHASTVPETDQERYWYQADELQLDIEAEQKNLKLGEPLNLKLKLQNKAGYSIIVPEFISPEYLYTSITVINPVGERSPMPSYILNSDSGYLSDLEANQTKQADATVFWSTKGFAFKQSGKHTIELQITWNIDGVPFGITAIKSIWVDAPVSSGDNEIASLLLDDEVGRWVMLGGADHLEDANTRINAAIKLQAQHEACIYMSSLMQNKKTGNKRKSRQAA